MPRVITRPDSASGYRIYADEAVGIVEVEMGKFEFPHQVTLELKAEKVTKGKGRETGRVATYPASLPKV